MATVVDTPQQLFVTNFINMRYELYSFSPPESVEEGDESHLHLSVHYFAVGINGETITNTVLRSQHGFADCCRSSLKSYIEQHEPFPMELIMPAEDAELMREGMSAAVEYLVRGAAGVPGMERLRVEVTIMIHQVEVDQEQVHGTTLVVGDYHHELMDGRDLDEGTRGERRMSLMEKGEAGDGGDEICAVCLEEMKVAVAVEVVWTPCDHQFHGECLRRWFDTAGSCPLCRFDFDLLLLPSGPDFRV